MDEPCWIRNVRQLEPRVADQIRGSVLLTSKYSQSILILELAGVPPLFVVIPPHPTLALMAHLGGSISVLFDPYFGIKGKNDVAQAWGILEFEVSAW